MQKNISPDGEQNGFEIKNVKRYVTVKILTVILILILPLNLLALISALRLSQEMQEQLKLNIRNITDVYVNTMDFNMQKADLYLFEFLTENEECIILKNQREDDDYKNAKYRCHRELNRQLSKEPMVDGYFFLMKRAQDSLVETASFLSEEKGELKNHLDQMEVKEDRWQIAEVGDRNYLIRISSEKDFYYGALISLEDLRQEITENTGYEEAEISFGKPGKEAKGVIQITSPFTSAAASLVVRLDSQVAFNSISFWNKALIFGAFLFLLTIPVLYFYMKRLVVQPLGLLNEAHHQMELGNREYQIEEMAETYEFQIAFDSFNQMMNSIENLRLENMKKELEKKKLELNNLQLQIRPHFLLNTFNLVYMLCTKNEVGSIKKLMLYLADYFRYIFRSGKDLEMFDKELKLIEGYILAAKIRYPERISILYQIEPEIRLVRVPPLLVHNFVENVITHALTHGNIVHIVLEAQYENGRAEFCISDDGCGMSTEQVRRINESQWEEEGENKHLGIRNAVMRLKHFYGEEARVTVFSEEGVGSTFVITFPYLMEEADGDENADCQ